jgi:hypothetical protein
MKSARLILLCSTISVLAFGQQNSGAHRDTSAHGQILLLDPGLSTGRPVLLLPPELQEDAGPVIPPTLIPSALPNTPPPFLLGAVELKADLTSPFRLQMAREEEMRPWVTVLGAISAGGAMYEAYRYIKKYGLK